MTKECVLITGANGQIGTVLAKKLEQTYGPDHVIGSDLKLPSHEVRNFEQIDVLDTEQLNRIVSKHGVTQIYHLAAILSAKGEQQPRLAWNVNIRGLLNVLELARESSVQKVFFPSSIAVYGSDAPKINTPQDAPLHPESVYGISKVAGELWCKYYHYKYGVDVRSIRYPGIVSHDSMPGGGTTDYAVDIFHKALKEGKFECFLKPDTALPMMYMADAIKATIGIMEADSDQLLTRSGYNIAGMTFTPAELGEKIKTYVPGFNISYAPDFRQEIAESWPASIDDTQAQEDWDWVPDFLLDGMVAEMFHHLEKKVAVKN